LRTPQSQQFVAQALLRRVAFAVDPSLGHWAVAKHGPMAVNAQACPDMSLWAAYHVFLQVLELDASVRHILLPQVSPYQTYPGDA
jgi:hypothetical protein